MIVLQYMSANTAASLLIMNAVSINTKWRSPVSVPRPGLLYKRGSSSRLFFSLVDFAPRPYVQLTLAQVDARHGGQCSVVCAVCIQSYLLVAMFGTMHTE